MRILVTGSRDWKSRDTVVGALLQQMQNADPGDITVVTGGCPTGADKMAEDVAEYMEWTVERHEAKWDELGADICLAFIRNNSKGASGTAELAESQGILTVRYHM